MSGPSSSNNNDYRFSTNNGAANQMHSPGSAPAQRFLPLPPALPIIAFHPTVTFIFETTRQILIYGFVLDPSVDAGKRWYHLVDAPPPPAPQVSATVKTNESHGATIPNVPPGKAFNILPGCKVDVGDTFWTVEAVIGLRNIIDTFRAMWPTWAQATVAEAEEILADLLRLEQVQSGDYFDATVRHLKTRYRLTIKTTSDIERRMGRSNLCLVVGYKPPGMKAPAVDEGVQHPVLPKNSLFCVQRELLGLMSARPKSANEKNQEKRQQLAAEAALEEVARQDNPPIGASLAGVFCDASGAEPIQDGAPGFVDVGHAQDMISDAQELDLFTAEEAGEPMNVDEQDFVGVGHAQDVIDDAQENQKALQNRERMVDCGVYYKLKPITAPNNKVDGSKGVASDGGGSGSGAGAGAGGDQNNRPVLGPGPPTTTASGRDNSSQDGHNGSGKRPRTRHTGPNCAMVADFMDSVVEVVEAHMAGGGSATNLAETFGECARKHLAEEWLNHRATVQGMIAPAVHRWIDTAAGWEHAEKDGEEWYQRVAELHTAVNELQTFSVRPGGFLPSSAPASHLLYRLEQVAPDQILSAPAPPPAMGPLIPPLGVDNQYMRVPVPSFAANGHGSQAPPATLSAGHVAGGGYSTHNTVAATAGKPRRVWRPNLMLLLLRLLALAAFGFACFGMCKFFEPSMVGFRNSTSNFIQGIDAELAAKKVERYFPPLSDKLDAYLRDCANSTDPSLREQGLTAVGTVWYETDKLVLSSTNRTWGDAAWGVLRPAVSFVARPNETMLAEEVAKSTFNELDGKVEARLEGKSLEGPLPPEKVEGVLGELLQARVLAAVGPLKWEQLRYTFNEERCAELLPDPDGLKEEVDYAVRTTIATLAFKYRLHPKFERLQKKINATVHAHFAAFCPQNAAPSAAGLLVGTPVLPPAVSESSPHSLAQTPISVSGDHPLEPEAIGPSTCSLPTAFPVEDGGAVGNCTECAATEAPAGIAAGKQPQDTEGLRGLALKSAKAAVDASTTKLTGVFAPVVHNPYKPSSIRSASKLKDWRQDWVEATINTIERGGMDAEAWQDVADVVQRGVHAAFDDIERAIEDRMAEITKRVETAAEEAQIALSTAYGSFDRNGAPAAVNNDLTAALRGALQAFRSAAVIDDVEPPPSYEKKLRLLKEYAAMLWRSAHDANDAVHAVRRQQLQATSAGAVTERINHGVHTCSNTHHDHVFDLAVKLPQHFGPQARANLHSVRVRLDGSGGGEGGPLNLDPAVGEHLVCTNGIGGGKYNGNRVYYNPSNAVLRVYLEGGGWGGGTCSNPLWMSYVDLTITRNALALPENAVYNQPYTRGEAPVF